MRKQMRDFCWLFVGQMYELRLSWFWFAIQMSLAPLLQMFLLYMYGGRGNPQATLYAVTGSLAQGLTVSSMLSLGQTVGWMKDQNAYEHFATLPISRTTFLLALTTQAMVLSMPCFVTILVVGVTVLGLPLHFHPLLIPVALLGGYMLGALGAFIGFYSPTGRVSSLATQVLAGMMATLAPVFVTLDQLPRFLRVTSSAVPTTYVARALRAILTGGVTSRLWMDMGIMALVALVSFWLVTQKLDWRVQR